MKKGPAITIAIVTIVGLSGISNYFSHTNTIKSSSLESSVIKEYPSTIVEPTTPILPITETLPTKTNVVPTLPLPIEEYTSTPSLERTISTCCKYCSKGKACGNSCISRSYTCHKPPGCACDL